MATYPDLWGHIFRGTKFMAVAWMGAAVNSACLYLFKGVLGMRIIPASMLAIEIALIHNFIWLRYWAWSERRIENHQPFFRQLLTYNLATGSVDLLLNVSLLWTFSTVFKIHYLIANLLAMLGGPFVKFWLNEKVIFRKARP